MLQIHTIYKKYRTITIYRITYCLLYMNRLKVKENVVYIANVSVGRISRQLTHAAVSSTTASSVRLTNTAVLCAAADVKVCTYVTE